MTLDPFSQVGRTVNPTEDIQIFLVYEQVLFEALQWISGCEGCSDHALIRLDYILDAVTGANPTATEYLMCRPTLCPRCDSYITEKTQITVC